MYITVSVIQVSSLREKDQASSKRPAETGKTTVAASTSKKSRYMYNCTLYSLIHKILHKENVSIQLLINYKTSNIASL